MGKMNPTVSISRINADRLNSQFRTESLKFYYKMSMGIFMRDTFKPIHPYAEKFKKIKIVYRTT